MEETGCEITCGALTTLAVKEQLKVKVKVAVWREDLNSSRLKVPSDLPVRVSDYLPSLIGNR